jgi:uncharacterized protein
MNFQYKGTEGFMPNRLLKEKSPYLLQHANNPVDWYPWGPEAFESARRQNKPIFLSVGYATCHWCHVMERESFEDPEAAAALNRAFVCIKVDREERPDIDTLYMAACQLVTGSGGWPMTVVMTADKKPFFAGTYIPKNSVMGRMGLLDLCEKITELWEHSPERITETADTIVGHLRQAFHFEADGADHPDAAVIERAVQDSMRRYDAQFGGFDDAPKFPMAHRLLFLLGTGARSGDEKVLAATAHTLTAMRLSGLWDHVGFGFHRYSTDRQWLLPHFEKMLYDQAFLAMAYLKGYEITGRPLFAQTAREIFAYVLRDMTDVRGGFYTAEDADSEGEEGKFYVWTQKAFENHLEAAPHEPHWTRIFNLQPEGNFLEEATRRKTGTNIPHLTQPWDDWAKHLQIDAQALEQQWERLRRRLFDTRTQRVPPLKDDKILSDWNGMMIAALAAGARILSDSTYLDTARKAAMFILDQLRDGRGRLLHRYRDGDVAIAATANDYAFFIMGLIALFRSDGDQGWLHHATEMQHRMNADFADADRGGFFLTAAEEEDLPVRPKEIYDGATPSANAVALHNLVHLGQLTGDRQWNDQARDLIKAFGGSVRRQPVAYLHTLDGWALYRETAL